MKQRKVIVVGGGASGLVAAIVAARSGAFVTIVEQKEQVGKKILSTGNGRCNLTNEYMQKECFRGDDITGVTSVLEQFGYEMTCTFFEELGVCLKNRQGYIYPVTDQATTILDVLILELKKQNVQVLLNETVINICKKGETFIVKTKESSIQGDAVILATGGKAASVLGSDGSGYTLAKAFGHRLSPVVPALVQLRCEESWFKQIAGVRTHAKVSLYVDEQFLTCDVGEVQLTNYGISGIPVFQISRYVAKGLYYGQRISVEIDLMPEMTEEQFVKFMKQRMLLHGQKSAQDFMIGIFHKKLISVLLKQANIPLSVSANTIREEKWNTLLDLCKHLKVVVYATNEFDQAQVCAGGVKLEEIDIKSMESTYVKDLYLTGELLDIDGICGGYNLQWAWATGYIAGKHSAKGNAYDSSRTT